MGSFRPFSSFRDTANIYNKYNHNTLLNNADNVDKFLKPTNTTWHWYLFIYLFLVPTKHKVDQCWLIAKKKKNKRKKNTKKHIVIQTKNKNRIIHKIYTGELYQLHRKVN